MRSQIAVYARVSSDKQADANTIASQIARIKDHAKEKGEEIEEKFVFADNGVSGTTLVRPALDQLRDRALHGEIEKVLVLSPDRLARKNIHQLILIEEFQKLGVELVFVNRHVGDSPEDQLLLQIQGVISEYEREKISERMRRGRIYKAKQGCVNVLVKAPYGYVYIKKSEGHDARYEIHEEQAKVVREIFRMYAYDKLSMCKIQTKLRELQILSFTGGKVWSTASLHGLLSNPAYHGKAAINKIRRVERKFITKTSREKGFYTKRSKSGTERRVESEWISIDVPAIVDEQTWQIVKAQKDENKKLAPRNNTKNQYLLRSLLHCETCGYHIHGVTPSTKKYADRQVYRCSGRDMAARIRGQVCWLKPIPVADLDKQVWLQVENLILHPKQVLREYCARAKKQKNVKLNHERLLQRKRAEIRNREREKQRMLDLYQQGTIERKDIESRLIKIQEGIRKTEAEMKLLEREYSAKSKSLQLVQSFESFTKQIRERLPRLTFEEKRQILRLLVRSVSVNARAGKITIEHVLRTQENIRLRSDRMSGTQQAQSR